MASSLQHISDKMMKMDIDKLGVQSLGLSLIPAVPDKFLIKYDPPKIWVVYHFKDHSEKDQYWRDIPLEFNTDSTASSVTDFLFKEHSYYFDSSLVGQEQVNKLIRMIIKNKDSTTHNEDSKAAPADNRGTTHNKHKSNRLFDDIQKARNLEAGAGESLPKKNALEPLNHPPKGKLEPLQNKPQPADDGFDLLDLDDLGGPAKNNANNENKPEQSKNDNIEDDYAFDFEFETPADNGGTKAEPQKEEKPAAKEQKASINMEMFEKEKEK